MASLNQISLNIISTTDDSIEPLYLQVSFDLSISNLKIIIRNNISKTLSNNSILHLFYNENEVNDNMTLNEIGITENNDMLILYIDDSGPTTTTTTIEDEKTSSSLSSNNNRNLINISRTPQRLSEISNDLWRNPKELYRLLKSNINLQREFNNANPILGNLVANGNIIEFESAINERLLAIRMHDEEKNNQIRQLNLNPLDPKAQEKIEEEIRMKNIQDNFETANEHIPESFVRVMMLYIPMKINDKEVIALVDSGAQSSIMHESCAKELGISRFIDARVKGQIAGVGSTIEMLGRIHAVQVKIGNDFFYCSFLVHKGEPLKNCSLLFGLDMLKRHQAIIDLSSTMPTLRMGRGANESVVPFLSDQDMNRISTTNTSSSSSNLQTSSSSSSSSSSSHSHVAPIPTNSQQQQEEKVQSLISRFECTQAEAEHALLQCQGNVDLAASYIVSTKYNFN